MVFGLWQPGKKPCTSWLLGNHDFRPKRWTNWERTQHTISSCRPWRHGFSIFLMQSHMIDIRWTWLNADLHLRFSAACDCETILRICPLGMAATLLMFLVGANGEGLLYSSLALLRYWTRWKLQVGSSDGCTCVNFYCMPILSNFVDLQASSCLWLCITNGHMG